MSSDICQFSGYRRPGSELRVGRYDRAVELIPAIDLLDGVVVRLSEGDFARTTRYADDPVATARRWVDAGATRLHLVDLDGARQGRPVQAELMARIVAAVAIPCQVAGGLRDETAVGAAFDYGADRVVLGSALLRDAGLGARLVARWGGSRIVAAIDVRGGLAVGSGWTSDEGSRPFDAVLRVQADTGIELFALTAIARDGLLEGPDFALLDATAAIVGANRVIASAGVSSSDDVALLARRGYAGAILGRALYEGALTLAAARLALQPS